jgi:hypothetical protein
VQFRNLCVFEDAQQINVCNVGICAMKFRMQFRYQTIYFIVW